MKANALLQNSAGGLKQDTEYTDVTLAEKEEHCLETHKVVLTSASTAMAEQQLNICKHYQTGFCKFKDECQKTHEHTMCENMENCSVKNCCKRHPKICRNFKTYGDCRHKEKCAYQHKQNYKQTMLNEQITQGLLKHEADIKALTEEVTLLRNLIQYLALGLTNTVQKENKVSETAEQENCTNNKEAEALLPEPILHCGKCSFTCDKVITLNKHKNTKHMEQKKQSDDGTQHDYKKNFYCDECPFSFNKKKDLKKHKDNEHTIKKVSNELKNKNNEHKHTAEVEEKACECKTESVCNKCLDK